MTSVVILVAALGLGDTCADVAGWFHDVKDVLLQE